MNIIEELKNISAAYLKARAKFLKEVELLYDMHNSTELSGNDNIVGRIGEFVAYQYLVEQGYSPEKPKNTKSNPAFDFICKKTKEKISVKAITSENNIGRTTRVKMPWDIFILIEIGPNQKISRMGVIKKDGFLRAIKKYPRRSQEPFASRSMLNSKGLLAEYGYLIPVKLVKKYL